MSNFSEEQIKEIYKVARKLAQEAIDKARAETWIPIEWVYEHSHVDSQLLRKYTVKIYCIETKKVRTM